MTDHRTECLATIDQMRGALCDLADWLDLHPDLTVACHDLGSVSWGIHQPADFPAAVRALMDGAPIGAIEKSGEGETMYVKRTFGPGIRVIIYAARSTVCTRRVVGTETVTVEALEAGEYERDIVEWDCPPILAGVQS